MNLLFCGDIVGRPGRRAVCDHLPGLRKELALDFVVANGENAAAGFGLTAKICAQLHDAGVDGTTEIPGLTFQVPWTEILVVSGLAYGMTLLTTWLPAAQASRIKPAEALRYE